MEAINKSRLSSNLSGANTSNDTYKVVLRPPPLMKKLLFII